MKIFKTTIGIVILLITTLTITNIALAYSDRVVPSDQKVYVNNELKNVGTYNINGSNYFMLRDLAEMLNNTSSQFDVVWNQSQQRVEITTGKNYSESTGSYNNNATSTQYVEVSRTTIVTDGIDAGFHTYNINGNNYLKLRDIAESIPFAIDFDESNEAIRITTGITRNMIRTQASNPIGKQNPDYYVWASPIKEYIYCDNASNFQVVDCAAKDIYVDTYNSKSYKHESTKKIDFELDYFGGVYAGTKYNFIVFGQENPNNDNNCTTFRVVKYSKDWNRLGECNLSGTHTNEPFFGGSLRMIEDRGYLYVRTSHRRYDGHQSNFTFSVNIETMKKADGHYEGKGYVSHSFDQYIAMDGDDLVALDLGDAYPRAVVINRYNDLRGDGMFNRQVETEDLNLVEIPGEIGQNNTGICLGGLGIGENNYIAAVEQDGDACLFIHDKRFSEELADVKVNGTNEFGYPNLEFVWDSSFLGVKRIQLSDFKNSNTVGPPFLVKLPDNNFMVLWVDDDGTEYVKVNEKGEKLSSVETLKDVVLTQQPIINNGEIIWYKNNNGVSRTFYRIKI